MTDAATLLEPLAGEMPNREGVLAPVSQQIVQAEAELDAHNARAAIATAQAASEAATHLGDAIQTYRGVRSAIVQGRKDAAALEANGYRMEASHAALDYARAALEEAATALQHGELAATQLDTARQWLEQAQASGPALVQLREENEGRIAALEARGNQVAELIVGGQQSFDLVDEFAESSWSDIRGNGTEAQNAADQAEALWERAVTRNTMENQEFSGARDDLDAASALLDRATALIEAIIRRLADLQAARDAARDELAAAAADIAAGQQFIGANDPDVSARPEQRLQTAITLLQQAQAEASKEKPDWLALVRQAQAANTEADAAFADARSEVEVINKLRAQIARAQQIAIGEAQKIEQFVAIHAADIEAISQQSLRELRQEAQAADALFQQASATEDDARRRRLEDVFGRYTRLQEQAAQLYKRVYDAFQKMEELRTQLGHERGRATLALNEATRQAGTYGALLGPDAEPLQLIERARALLSQSQGAIDGEANLKAHIETARQARADAERATLLIRERPHQMPTGPVFTGGLGGPLFGELFDEMSRQGRRGGDFGGFPDFGDFGGWGSRRESGRSSSRRSSGSSWPSGGGSRSSGSWGGGSRSGGSWGGGSRSGGSRGGGSRSGGGW